MQHWSQILTMHKYGWTIIFRKFFNSLIALLAGKISTNDTPSQWRKKKKQKRLFILNSISFVFSAYTFSWQDKLNFEYLQKISVNLISGSLKMEVKGGFRTAATCRMEHVVIIVNGWKPLNLSQSAPSLMLQ